MNIIVAPLHEVEVALDCWRPSHVVSLFSPGDEPVLPPTTARRLSLAFNDIAEPRSGLVTASEDDVARLLVFAEDWATDTAGPLLIQCWAGVSRSPAAAFVIACALAPDHTEADVAGALRLAAPTATPNPLLVALADRRLGRDGRMVRAIAEIGRGEETATGSTFTLALRAGATTP